MLRLAEFASSKGAGFFVIRDLAKRCRLGLRTVKGAIANLKNSGDLEITETRRGPGSKFDFQIPGLQAGEGANSAPVPSGEKVQNFPQKVQILHPSIKRNRKETRKSSFIPPTKDECIAFAADHKDAQEKDGEHFWNKLTGKGWAGVHDWRATFFAHFDAGWLLTKPKPPLSEREKYAQLVRDRGYNS